MIITFIMSFFLTGTCDTPTSWVETVETGTPDQYVRPVCGDEDGNVVSYPRFLTETGIVVFVSTDQNVSFDSDYQRALSVPTGKVH